MVNLAQNILAFGSQRMIQLVRLVELARNSTLVKILVKEGYIKVPESIRLSYDATENFSFPPILWNKRKRREEGCENPVVFNVLGEHYVAAGSDEPGKRK